jgi:hypothetical protein
VLLRVGVTGHRSVDDVAEVTRCVDTALDDALAAAGATTLEVWTSLAEGSDRLVADRVLARPDSRAVVVLPLAAEQYRTDFDTSDSVAEFDRLLAAARLVEVTGPDGSGTRESAYERAGHAVIDGCDVLLALWDGQPSRGRGGTAEIVAEARRRGRPVVVIPNCPHGSGGSA